MKRPILVKAHFQLYTVHGKFKVEFTRASKGHGLLQVSLSGVYIYKEEVEHCPTSETALRAVITKAVKESKRLKEWNQTNLQKTPHLP